MKELPIKIRIRRNGTRLRPKPGNSAVRRRANRSKGVSPFSNRPCSSNPGGLDLRSTQLSPPARVRAQSRQGRQMVAGGANHRNSTHFAGNPGRGYRILRTRFLSLPSGLFHSEIQNRWSTTTTTITRKMRVLKNIPCVPALSRLSMGSAKIVDPSAGGRPCGRKNSRR